MQVDSALFNDLITFLTFSLLYVTVRQPLMRFGFGLYAEIKT